MHRKLSILAVIGSVIFGTTNAIASARFNGFYLGGSAGYSSYTGNQKFNMEGGRYTENSDVSLKSFGSGSGGLFLGAQKQLETFGNIVVGIEVFYDIFDRAKSTASGKRTVAGNSLLNYTVRNEIKNTFGGAFKFGKVFDQNKLVYFKLGLTTQTVKTNIHGSSRRIVGNDFNFNESKSSTVLAFSPAVGLDVGLTDRISLGTEYQVTPRLFRKSLEFTHPFGALPADHTIRLTPNATRHKIQLRLTYKI